MCFFAHYKNLNKQNCIKGKYIDSKIARSQSRDCPTRRLASRRDRAKHPQHFNFYHIFLLIFSFMLYRFHAQLSSYGTSEKSRVYHRTTIGSTRYLDFTKTGKTLLEECYYKPSKVILYMTIAIGNFLPATCTSKNQYSQRSIDIPIYHPFIPHSYKILEIKSHTFVSLILI